MTFAIQYHVGAKYGSRMLGNDRYPSRVAAQWDIDHMTTQCARHELSAITARVVDLADRKGD